MADFKVGDKVTWSHKAGEEFTVQFGPFDEKGLLYDHYLISDSEGQHRSVSVNHIAHAALADPRREVVARALYADVYGGDPDAGSSWRGTREDYLHAAGVAITALDAHEGTGWERVTGDTEVIDGVTYELAARYRDHAGDVWARQSDGLWWVDEWENGMKATIDVDYTTDNEYFRDYPLANVVTQYGPLTKL